MGLSIWPDLGFLTDPGLPFTAHILGHDAADAQSIGCLYRIMYLSILFLILLHGLVHVIRAVLQDIIQAGKQMLVASRKKHTRTLENAQNSQFNSSPSSAHAKNQPKVDMLTLFSDVVVAKKLNDLEKLLEMKILLTSHHVDHMIKLVFFVLNYPRGPSEFVRAQRAVQRIKTYTTEQFTDITGQVQRCAISFSTQERHFQLVAVRRSMLSRIWKKTYRRTVVPSLFPALPGKSCVKSTRRAPLSSREMFFSFISSAILAMNSSAT